MQPVLEQSWQQGQSAEQHGERGQGKPPPAQLQLFPLGWRVDAGGYSPLPVGQVSGGLCHEQKEAEALRMAPEMCFACSC